MISNLTTSGSHGSNTHRMFIICRSCTS